MTDRERSQEQRRTSEPTPAPPLVEEAADTADVIEQREELGSEDAEGEAGVRTEGWERGEASEADASEQLRSVTDPEEDYR